MRVILLKSSLFILLFSQSLLAMSAEPRVYTAPDGHKFKVANYLPQCSPIIPDCPTIYQAWDVSKGLCNRPGEYMPTFSEMNTMGLDNTIYGGFATSLIYWTSTVDSYWDGHAYGYEMWNAQAVSLRVDSDRAATVCVIRVEK